MDVDRHRSARIPRHGSSGGAGWFGEMDLVSTPDLPLMTAVGMGRGGGGGGTSGKEQGGGDSQDRARLSFTAGHGAQNRH